MAESISQAPEAFTRENLELLLGLCGTEPYVANFIVDRFCLSYSENGLAFADKNKLITCFRGWLAGEGNLIPKRLMGAVNQIVESGFMDQDLPDLEFSNKVRSSTRERSLAVLEVLHDKRGQLVSHDEILESVGISSERAKGEISSRIINRLRKRLPEGLIQTVKGEGFILFPEAQSSVALDSGIFLYPDERKIYDYRGDGVVYSLGRKTAPALNKLLESRGDWVSLSMSNMSCFNLKKILEACGLSVEIDTVKDAEINYMRLN